MSRTTGAEVVAGRRAFPSVVGGLLVGAAAPSLAPPSAGARERRHSGVRVALLVAAVLEGVYVLLGPSAPDLPAQLARASAVSRGVGLWWAGWYGGINTATYSLLSARLMNVLGVGAVGVISTAAVCLFGADLVRSCARPRAGAVAIALAACANLYSGRITFAAGMAVALASICLLQRGYLKLSVFAALITGLVSPLAAMSEVLALGALLLTRRGRRRCHLLATAACCLPVGLVSLVFGQPSYMPFSADICLYALLACAGVCVAPVPRLVRVMAVLSMAVVIGAWVVHSPIGSNAARLPMLLAGPLVVATARGGHARSRLLIAGLVVWPLVGVSSDMAVAAQPSSHSSFYTPLLAHLPPSGRSTQRVEVLDPATHGAAFFLTEQVLLARGWERQIDAAGNPLFYNGTLTSGSYRAWLIDHAAGWVAVPAAQLDYGAVSERALIARGLPYLHLAWSDARWRLYRVTLPAPAASGVLRVIALTDSAVEMTATAAGTGVVRVPYSAMLTVRSTRDPDVVGCVRPGQHSSSLVTVPSSGSYLLHAEMRALTAPGC